MSAETPTKVAIVGGGCAAITTAFELSRPEHAGRYDITVYQQGWRLGGKGASGRGPSGRIEEHGLHIWLGFYENAFGQLRECYAELARDPQAFDFGDWRDAFITENRVGLSAQQDGEPWHNWSTVFPPRPGLPGDPATAQELFSVQRYLAGALSMLGALIESVDSRRARPGDAAATASPPRTDDGAVISDPRKLAAAIRELIGGSIALNAAVLAEGLALLQAGLKMLPSGLANPLTDLASWFANGLRKWLEATVRTEPYYQHLWEMMDIVVAMVVGALRFGLLTDPRGFDAIDEYESIEWLLINGASERSVRSAFVRGSYDLCMAYEDGDPERPRLSAAVALRCTFRMFFSYRGALYWRLRAGMGDIVFAPYYEALRRRGVKFEFFHRLRNVALSDPAEAGSPYVAALEFDVQAKVKGGGDYQPLVEVQGRPCWPSEPDFKQLAGGKAMAAAGRDFESHWDEGRAAAKTLEVTKDFDFVVLGVSVAELPNVCREVLARDERWRRMVRHVATVETQAFQIWLNEDLRQLGWSASNFIGAAFTKPFDTWCDMAHTVPEEGWSKPPRTALYFCGALQTPQAPPDPDDPSYPASRQAVVRANALKHLQETAKALWPGAYDAAGTFRWSLLVDAGDPAGTASSAAGPERFDTQFWRANVNPTDRYVLAMPGTAKHRISPLDPTYDNMTLAGDWTACGLNEGCVEAAVISGRLAAHALSGAPKLEDIVGYDHP